jgi:hypothetical protein
MVLSIWREQTPEGRVKHMAIMAVACWIALVPARAAEGVVTYQSLAPDVAFDLAHSALEQCRKDGYQVAVVVGDRFGAPLIELRDRYTRWARLTSRRVKPGPA